MPSKPPGCGSSGGAFLGPAPGSLFGDHLAVVGLDDRGTAVAEQLLAFGEGCGEVVREGRTGYVLGTDTTNAPDSIAMWRTEARPSRRSPTLLSPSC
jgi:hypothetical protein